MVNQDGRDLCCRWQEVVHKAGVQKLSLCIIHQTFKKRAPDPLSNPAVNLALDNRWVDDASAVMHRCVFEESNHTGRRIDLDNGPVNATGEAAVRWAIEFAGFQAGSSAIRRERRPRTRPR